VLAGGSDQKILNRPLSVSLAGQRIVFEPHHRKVFRQGNQFCALCRGFGNQARRRRQVFVNTRRRAHLHGSDTEFF
jgi:hypothetical protein